MVRRTIWNSNVAKIRQHNIEAATGLHRFTMGMNRFGDLVRLNHRFFSFIFNNALTFD